VVPELLSVGCMGRATALLRKSALFVHDLAPMKNFLDDSSLIYYLSRNQHISRYHQSRSYLQRYIYRIVNDTPVLEPAMATHSQNSF
jgi:hypothetical protein